jgi:hypothetical protein
VSGRIGVVTNFEFGQGRFPRSGEELRVSIA